MSVLLSVKKKKKVQTREKWKNGVLHANVSLDALDKRARSGATGARTKTPLPPSVRTCLSQREKLPAAGWINRASVWGASGDPHTTQSPKIKERSVK